MKKEYREYFTPVNIAKLCGTVFLLLLVFVFRSTPLLSELYSRKIYPFIAYWLSWISSWVPFSLGDLFIIVMIVIIISVFIKIVIGFGSRLLNLIWFAKYLASIYVWLYIAWGLNYFREDIFQRLQVENKPYDKEAFVKFLNTYISNLDSSYVSYNNIDKEMVSDKIKEQYTSLSPKFGIVEPWRHLEVKPSLFSSLLSKVGVAGYINPLFIEFEINSDVSALEYSFCYAHEMSHALGVANEAEANLCAYIVCTRSDSPEIKYSGYFAILPYVISDASRNLTKEEYENFLIRIKPDIKQQYNEIRAAWRGRYNKTIGEMQSYAYDKYLKSNNISSGIKNYSQVISMILSIPNGKI